MADMFDCVCDWRAEDSEQAEPFTEKMVVARKEHKCCECRTVIKPGDTYENVKGKWDGEWRTYKTCRVCAQMRKDMMSCGWVYGGLWEALREDSLGRYEDADWLG